MSQTASRWSSRKRKKSIKAQDNVEVEEEDDSTSEVSDVDEYSFKNPHKFIGLTLSSLFVKVCLFRYFSVPIS